MKRFFACVILGGVLSLISPAPLVVDAQQTPAAQRPELAILYTIDGFSDKAPARVAMPNFQTLVAQGAYFRQNYTVQTADPSNRFPPTPWAEYYTSSIPNVVQMSGTAMILPGKQKYVQDSFFPLKITVHAVNEISYRALDGSFHFTAQAGGSGMRAAGFKVGDDRTLFWATTFLREVNPAFMWIHMQDTGVAAGQSRGAPAGAQYRDNIWGEGSPYIKTLQQQDVYLGQFVDALKKSGKWERTVMFITGDHGEQTAGGHPANNPEAWTMPLVMVGPGIKKGVTFDYTEAIDTVPTLCYLMGVRPPLNADGRILAEGLVNPPPGVPPRQQKIKEINFLLLEIESALAKLTGAPGAASTSGGQGRFSALRQAQQDYYDIERILEWHQFGTYDRFIAHHKQLLGRLNAMLSK
jgi:hypothetical protein